MLKLILDNLKVLKDELLVWVFLVSVTGLGSFGLLLHRQSSLRLGFLDPSKTFA